MSTTTPLLLLGYDLDNEAELEQCAQYLTQALIVEERLPSEVFNITPEMTHLLYTYAYNLYQGGVYDHAMRLFSNLIFFDPTNTKAAMGLGACQQHLHYYKDAINTYALAWANDPLEPSPLYYAGLCCIEEKDYLKAQQFFQIFVTLAKHSPELAVLQERAELILKKDLQRISQ